MAITTYAEVQSAIQNWAGDSGLSTDRAKEFIALAEGEINDEIRTLQMETRATITATVGEEYLALPDNFGGLRSRPKITSTDPVRFLQFMTHSQIDTTRAASQTARPVVYTIVDESLRLRPVPDTSYTIEITYFLKVPALSDSNTTNWLLTSRPHIYLYACQAQYEDFVGNENTAAKWDQKFRRALEKLKQIDKHDRFSGSPLQMTSDVSI